VSIPSLLILTYLKPYLEWSETNQPKSHQKQSKRIEIYQGREGRGGEVVCGDRG